MPWHSMSLYLRFAMGVLYRLIVLRLTTCCRNRTWHLIATIWRPRVDR